MIGAWPKATSDLAPIVRILSLDHLFEQRARRLAQIELLEFLHEPGVHLVISRTKDVNFHNYVNFDRAQVSEDLGAKMPRPLAPARCAHPQRREVFSRERVVIPFDDDELRVDPFAGIGVVLLL